MTWTPTAENINALPEGVRDYIHRLEANTDPQGEVKRAMIAEMQLAAVNKMLEEAPEAQVITVLELPWNPSVCAIEVYADIGKVGGIKEDTRVRLVVVDD